MRDQFRPIATNLTPVNVVGIPGLVLVIIAIALAIQFPEVEWLVLAGVCGGALIAVAMIVSRSGHSEGDNGDPSHGVLHIYEPAAPRSDAPLPRSPSRGARACAPAGI